MSKDPKNIRPRPKHLWEVLTTGYWFVPAVMTMLAVGLGAFMLYVDRAVLRQDAPNSWFYSGGTDGTRSLLAAIAGSVITVAGVVFSITIAAITQASSQFGPRLLRNFMRDTVNQVVLGTFVATFVYCVLVLRAIRGSEQTTFVPHLSVTIGVLLTLVSIAVLIYFTVTFASIVGTSFSLIRQYGRTSPAVLIRMLEIIVRIAPRLNHANQREALMRHAEMIHDDGQETVPRKQDRQDLRQR